MAVYRVHKTDNYTAMSNHHLRDKSLSLCAKGLLSMILSLPPDWHYSISGLAAICLEGEKAVRTALNELRDRGYVVITRINPEQGQSRIRYEYDIYEIPQEQIVPETAKPQVGQAYPGVHAVGEHAVVEGVLNGGQLNKEEPSKDRLSTEDILLPKQDKKKTRKAKVFVPPTVDEVRAYVKEKGYHFSADQFHEYYAAYDWHFPTGRPVKSWKQCCVTWEGRVPESQKRKKGGSFNDYSDYDAAFH